MLLTALPEPRIAQLWAGLVAQPRLALADTVVAQPAPSRRIYLVSRDFETDRWFGLLFTNMRFPRCCTPLRTR